MEQGGWRGYDGGDFGGKLERNFDGCCCYDLNDSDTNQKKRPTTGRVPFGGINEKTARHLAQMLLALREKVFLFPRSLFAFPGF